jgi:hypothetical protein
MNGTISNKLVLAGIALLIAVGACAPADQIDEAAEAAMETVAPSSSLTSFARRTPSASLTGSSATDYAN